MKGLLFFIPFLLFGWFTPLNAQFLQIDFSESSINDWFGDTDKFLIVNEQLRLNDASAGSSNISYLSIPAPTSIGESTSWESWVYLDFSPSASNFARIYLTASQADLSASLNGYFLQVGGISGDQDAVELYRQDGDTPVLLISATAGAVGGTSALANIRVIRTEEGEWTLQADYTGGTNYQSEGTVTDKTYGMGNYFGYYCRYSSTRSDAFYFDDLLVNPIFQDQTPPDILAATSIDARTLAVTFNEAVDPASASQLSIYEIVPGPGLPQTALRSEEDPTVVLLTWATSFTNLQTYSLTVTGIRDLAGNQSGELSIDFTYVELAFPQTGDLLITEMLPDPSPPLGLPNAEFVEVYNASDKVLALEGIGLSSGGSPKILPAYQMLPNTYLILCDEADVNAFSAFGPALGLDGFPALTNGGDQITLTNEDGAVLVSLTYDLSWYKDSEKQDGGWSLELIRTDQSIDCVGNWSASNAANGGTPGQENSVKNNPLEGQGPILLSVYVASPTEIVLRFDETLDPIAATDPDAYSISGGLSITNARLGGVPSEIVLELSSALEPGTIYEVQTGTSITDCLGNQSESTVSRRVGLAETAAEGDLVINELLYMPEVG
ncbi:MAG: Ig-like domain-containing protein, partial [Lewinella sp.]|nr:Ig-like domain-containing protein [Lewinella sp.]